MEDISAVIGDFKYFLKRLFKNLDNVGINYSNFTIDHLAHRTDSPQFYEELKNKLLSYGRLLAEKQIRKRSVAIFKLDKPIKYKGYVIPCLEILAPAPQDRKYKNQLEHSEFVTDIPLQNFVKQYPKIDFKTDNLDRVVNPELILLFSNDVNAKFHQMSIEKVLELEEKLT